MTYSQELSASPTTLPSPPPGYTQQLFKRRTTGRIQTWMPPDAREDKDLTAGDRVPPRHLKQHCTFLTLPFPGLEPGSR